MKLRAEYRCLSSTCAHEWTTPAPGIVACPRCGGLYVEWRNYAKMEREDERFAAIRRDDECR